MRGQGGGPKTDKGKAASSRNALKHGLRSDAPVIPEMESFDDWERFRSGIVASFGPEGSFESFLSERIALLAWRLKRVPRFETDRKFPDREAALTAAALSAIAGGVRPAIIVGGISRSGTIRLNFIHAVVCANELIPNVSKKLTTAPSSSASTLGVARAAIAARASTNA